MNRESDGHAAADPLLARNPLSQRLGNDHAAIRLLIILEDGHQGPADSDGGAVQRMDKAGPLVLGTLETDVEPPRLEVGAVGSAGHLAVLARLAACRHPCFE